MMGSGLRGLVYALLIASSPGAFGASLGDKFSPDEEVDQSWNPLHPRITGTVNGVKYIRLGSAAAEFTATDPTSKTDIAYWKVTCGIDAMNDSRHCAVAQREFRVVYLRTCTPRVAVGSDHFPGTEAMVRLGKAPAISTREKSGLFTAAQSASIVAAMQANEKLAMRFVRWPREASVDDEISTKGFAEAAKYACWAIPRLAK